MSKRIKGYLPVRLSFPPVTTRAGTLIPATQHTFFYLREHVIAQPQCENRTLFLTNVPVYPGIRSRLLLHSLLEPYGVLESVVILRSIPGEEKKTSFKIIQEDYGDIVDEHLGGSLEFFTQDMEYEWYVEGKFAHVTFISSNEMKRALERLESTTHKTKEWEGIALEIDNMKVQELQSSSRQLFVQHRNTLLNTRIHRSDNESSDNLSAIGNYVESLKVSRIPLSILNNACNDIVEQYDTQEDNRKQLQKETNQPDDDGFVQVLYSNDTNTMEERHIPGSVADTSHRRRGLKRSRNKTNICKGSDVHNDFYRFQRKEHKKKEFDDLQTRFQEDLKKLAQMKEKNAFKPF